MHKTWFHHFVTGMLAAADISKPEVSSFLEAYPSQSNAHLLAAIQDMHMATPAKVSAHASYLPDRRVLWVRSLPADTAVIASSLSEDTFSPGLAPTQAGQWVADTQRLPVYVPFALAEADDEGDDEIESLEARLLARLEEEIEDAAEDVDSAPSSTSGIYALSGDDTPPPPLLERLDLRVGAIHFGQPVDTSAPQAAYLDWLAGLRVGSGAEAPVEHQVGLNDEMTLHADVVEDMQGASAVSAPQDQKKKKGSKKLAKQLAKKSIKPDRQVATETLARILTEQGHLQEAIAMYERLRLLIPEKSAIFAVQIQKLKEKLK
jgi:hypothetical protein